MTLPITFSPPGDSYLPAAEDALRDGLLLMFKADNLTRKRYSFDDEDPAKGVRIFAGPWAATEGPPQSRKLILPQLLVTGAFASTGWTYATGNAGEKKIKIVITDLVPQDSSYHEMDVTTPEITAEAVFARIERVIMFGTLWAEGQGSQSAKVVHPYRTPVLGSGLYDPAQIVYLNGLAPDLRRSVSLVGEIAVAYNLEAIYTVDVQDRDDMTEAGFE